MRQTRAVQIGPAPVEAARISYAGELGWELTTAVAWAVDVWDRLRRAGEEFGLEPFGYRALDALRMEKGYRYFGTDLTMLDTPDEAGLGPFVRLDAGPFIGRDELRAARDRGSDRRLRTLVIGGPEYEPIYGGEAVRLGSDVIGRLRSVAYGPTIEKTIGYAYLPASTPEGTALDVDVFDRRVGAVVAADVLVDPAGEHLRG
jgi:glycine cleavage system aminomethyltransferase T